MHARALHRHPRLAALFFGAVAPAVVLGLRVSVGPAVVPATVRGWMTTNYVARAYGIDRDARAAVLGTEPGRLQGLTLCEITQALGFADSERRYRQLVATLGTPLQFSPRRRDDLQFLFVAGQPVQGRLIRPQLKFHFAGDLPVYSISDIYDPNPAANEDLDGLVFPDMPWTLAQDPDTTQLRETLARTWPQAVRRRGRLYAMGFDAFRLVEHLETGERSGDATAAPVSTHAGDPIAGLTGRLTVGPDGRIRRTLDWAAIGPDGRPRPLPSVVIAP